MPINLVADKSSVPSIHCKLADEIALVDVEINGVDHRGDGGGGGEGADATNDSKSTQHNTTDRHQATSTTQQQYAIKVEYFAYKEKLLREELKLINANNSVELLKLVITARVLGKGKGTPMLRNGIHCIGSEPDEELEMSEDSSAGANHLAGPSHASAK